MTDAQGALLERLLPKARPGGRPRQVDLRAVANALFYRNRNGCTWRALAHDCPPWKTVANYFPWWHWDGPWDQSRATLRPQVRAAVGGPLVPKRGVVERTFAWRGRERIHSQDDARLVESSAAQVKIRRIHRMLRRLSNARSPDRFR